MTFCLTCNAEKHPVQAYTTKGLVDACPTCQGVFVRHEPNEPPAPAPAEPTAAPARPVAAPAPSAAPPDALSLVDQMRARLVAVEAEIAKRDAYLAEREMLCKMLAAADGETRPTTEARPLN